MLIDVTFKNDGDSDIGSILNMIAKLNNNSVETIKHQPGIYQIGHWNGSELFQEKIIDQWDMKDLNDNEYFSTYGVCDNYEQILKKCPMLETSSRKFVIFIVSVKKENQSPEGGWRWHKWGEYIGTQNPQYEYLYNESEIDEVFTYHIYELE